MKNLILFMALLCISSEVIKIYLIHGEKWLKLKPFVFLFVFTLKRTKNFPHFKIQAFQEKKRNQTNLILLMNFNTNSVVMFGSFF